MKTIEWLCDSKMIPSYGMGLEGKLKTLPNNIADSFIKQGLAKEIIPTAKKKVKKESE